MACKIAPPMRNNTFGIIILLLLTFKVGRAQKKALDSLAIRNWPAISVLPSPAISQNVSYAFYLIKGIPVNSQVLIVRCLAKKTNQSIIGAEDAFFSSDSKSIIYKRNDTLFKQNLANYSKDFVSGISSVKSIQCENRHLALCKTTENNQKIVLVDLLTGKKKTFEQVIDYVITDDNKKIFFKTGLPVNNGQVSLICYELMNDKSAVLWDGEAFESLLIDKSGERVAFIALPMDSSSIQSSLFYRSNSSELIKKIADDRQLRKGDSLAFEKLIAFDINGNRLFLNLKPLKNAVSKNKNPNVWTYKTLYLSPQPNKEEIIYSYNLISNTYVRLHNKGENLQLFTDQNNDELAIATSIVGDGAEVNWNSAIRINKYKVSTVTGERVNIDAAVYMMSPNGTYISHHTSSQELIMEDLKSNIQLNISQLIKSSAQTVQIEAWLPADSGVIVFDGSDLWKVNLKKSGDILNITSEYGIREGLVFHIPYYLLKNQTLSKIGNELVLSAFNSNTKQEGFYLVNLSGLSTPQLLSWGSYQYMPLWSNVTMDQERGIKKKKAYIFLRSNASESPNCVITTDFKKFEAISSIHPEKNYNWLNTELISFKTCNGWPSRAILYKPENFNPNKKYPIVFYYYDQISDKLNNYITPEPFNGGINIPYLVSNGYLVCTPDIIFDDGPGKSAYNSVMGIASFLKQRTYVDAQRMGLYGHSFGGYETNYIVTHTGVFAAACSASAVSNLISNYGHIREGLSNTTYYETGQGRMKGSVWDFKARYIEESPIFFIDQVSTPILMMNNKLDTAVPFSQGVEFFLGLRRLAKKVWFLSYDGEGHTIDKPENAKDYTKRVIQFFDHYLKNKKAPLWMNDEDYGKELYGNEVKGPVQ